MISNRTYIEISGDNLRHNLVELTRDLPSDVRSMCVVKSNAYGHGLLQVAWSLQSVADWFAVDDIEEAKILRQHGIRNPILVLGAVPEEWYQAARSLRLTLTSSSIMTLRWAVNHGVQTHIKVDTGLGRQGFTCGEEFAKLVQYVARNKPEQITGIYTHYAVADNLDEVEYTIRQFEGFDVMAAELQNALQRILLKHTSGTSGALYRNQFACDMVRLGIGLYGVWPSHVLGSIAENIELRPVMRWRTIVSEVKRLPKGSSVGYDRTFTTKRESIIGVIPIGYWHGFPRALSNVGFVMIRSSRVPVIGNVSMDMITVDLTEIGEVPIGEMVVLLGEGISAYELASSGQMSHYELLTCVNPHIERRLK